MLLAEEIFDCTNKLATNATSAMRYSHAPFGTRMLMAFLEWRRENAEKADSPDAQRYGKILQEWISLKDYAYVIQFETDYHNVAFLKAGAALALERETSPDRKKLLQCRSKRYQTDAGKTEDALVSTRFECGAISMRNGYRRFCHRIFTGNTLPVEWPFSPEHRAFSRWVELHDNRRTRDAIFHLAFQLTVRTMD